MAAPCEKYLRELVRNLCDEQIDSSDMRRLNQLLISDPLAQEEYLDQLYMDGLLQYEFAGSRLPPTIPSGVPRSTVQRGWLSSRMHFTVAAVLLAGCCGFWWFNSQSTRDFSVQLNNLSFEETAIVSQQPTLVGWYGDLARAVTGAPGVAPQHGNQMLRLVRSTSHPQESCEVYQIVDLRSVPRLSGQLPMFVEASAAVNSLSEVGGDSYVFAINLYASPDNPLAQQAAWPASWKTNLSFVGNQLTADYDNNSWEQIRSLLPLQSDTQFVLIQISVRNQNNLSGDDFPGQFVDNVQVRFRDPNTL